MRFVLLVVASLALMMTDYRQGLLDPIRQTVSALAHPIRLVAELPSQFIETADQQLASRRQLMAENERLRNRQQVFQARLQRLDALEVENIRLRSLLDSSYDLEQPVLIAELVQVDLDPFSHVIEIDKGLGAGVEVGQAVIDASGVIGQVDHVAPFSSTIRLISDPGHATPVQVNRNGLRSVALGAGRTDVLNINSLPNNADIQIGDLVVTSGLGGRFPTGYPVGEVSAIKTNPGDSFSTIQIAPSGALGRIQEVLLIRHEPAPTPQAEAGDDE